MFFLILATQAYALPVDWHGVIGVDSTLIDNFRQITEIEDGSGNEGSQEVPLARGNQANASFQSYVLRLSPVIVINDAATFKAEIGYGHGRGGRLGEDSSVSLEEGLGNSLYNIHNASGTDGAGLRFKQFYFDLYSDTATYVLGRQPSHWALGAVHNGGENPWDRHAYTRDGITMKVKLGNFSISPFWAKIGSGDSLTRATKVREYGFNFLYDNVQRDITMGMLYTKKANGTFNRSVQTRTRTIPDPEDGSNQIPAPIGRTDIKLIDLYFKKAFGDFSFAVEFPLLDGSIGNLYNQGFTKYKAKAIIFESKYKLNPSWELGFDWGRISGDSGAQTNYEAMYLHPNYQVANVLFRYNRRAIANPEEINIYDSYITNAMYFKFSGHYRSRLWSFKTSIITAKAQETAQMGSLSYNHSTNETFTAAADQQDDLGLEIDMDINYHWNTEIIVGGSLGYLFTGDYFAFTNTQNSNTPDDSFVLQFRTAIQF